MFVRQQIVVNIRLAILAAFAVVAAVILYAPGASANTANTIKISPVRADIEVQPGESRIVQVTISNPTNQLISVRPIINDFIAGDENGTPALILDETEYAPTRSLKRFVQPLSVVTIPAGKGATIDVTVTVPSDAKAGGYFGAVRLVPAATDGGGQVNLSASAASLILLSVPGDVDEQLDLTTFEVQQNGATGSNFRDGNNLRLALRFFNRGNVQAGPYGRISVKKGNEIVYETDFNNKNPRDVILPDGARAWNVPLENISGFGHYTIYATFTYGKDNKTIEVVQTFWIIPIWVIITAAAASLLLIVTIVILVLRQKGKRKRSKNLLGSKRR